VFCAFIKIQIISQSLVYYVCFSYSEISSNKFLFYQTSHLAVLWHW